MTFLLLALGLPDGLGHPDYEVRDAAEARLAVVLAVAYDRDAVHALTADPRAEVSYRARRAVAVALRLRDAYAAVGDGVVAYGILYGPIEATDDDITGPGVARWVVDLAAGAGVIYSGETIPFLATDDADADWVAPVPVAVLRHRLQTRGKYAPH